MKLHKAVEKSNYADEKLDKYGLRMVVSSSADHLAWMSDPLGLYIFAYNCEKSGDKNQVDSAKLYALPDERLEGYAIIFGQPPTNGRINLDNETPRYVGQLAVDFILG
jgi:hypothetical protein